jgi:hypothetical protein
LGVREEGRELVLFLVLKGQEWRRVRRRRGKTLEKELTIGFNLSVAKKYRRSPINGLIGFIGKFLGQK